MNNNAKKILGVLGLAAGGFILFSSFKGAEEVPVDPNDPNNPNNPDNPDEPIDPLEEPGICTQPETVVINGQYLVKQFMLIPVPGASQVYHLALIMEEYRDWKIQNYFEMTTGEGNYLNGSRFKILRFEISGGYEMIVTDMQLAVNGVSRAEIKKLNALTCTEKRIKFLAQIGPATPHIIVDFTAANILTITQSGRTCNILVSDPDNIIGRNLKVNDRIRIESTSNAIYNNMIVIVLGVSVYVNETKNRIINVFMTHAGDSRNGVIRRVSSN